MSSAPCEKICEVSGCNMPLIPAGPWRVHRSSKYSSSLQPSIVDVFERWTCSMNKGHTLYCCPYCKRTLFTSGHLKDRRNFAAHIWEGQCTVLTELLQSNESLETKPDYQQPVVEKKVSSATACHLPKRESSRLADLCKESRIDAHDRISKKSSSQSLDGVGFCGVAPSCRIGLNSTAPLLSSPNGLGSVYNPMLAMPRYAPMGMDMMDMSLMRNQFLQPNPCATLSLPLNWSFSHQPGGFSNFMGMMDYNAANLGMLGTGLGGGASNSFPMELPFSKGGDWVGTHPTAAEELPKSETTHGEHSQSLRSSKKSEASIKLEGDDSQIKREIVEISDEQSATATADAGSSTRHRSSRCWEEEETTRPAEVSVSNSNNDSPVPADAGASVASAVVKEEHNEEKIQPFSLKQDEFIAASDASSPASSSNFIHITFGDCPEQDSNTSSSANINSSDSNDQSGETEESERAAAASCRSTADPSSPILHEEDEKASQKKRSRSSRSSSSSSSTASGGKRKARTEIDPISGNEVPSSIDDRVSDVANTLLSVCDIELANQLQQQKQQLMMQRQEQQQQWAMLQQQQRQLMAQYQQQHALQQYLLTANPLMQMGPTANMMPFFQGAANQTQAWNPAMINNSSGSSFMFNLAATGQRMI